MPLYEYECDACGHRFEVIQKFSDPPIEKCPTCGGPVHKLQSAPAFHLKGTGWYLTDYAKKDSGKTEGAAEKAEKAEKASGEKDKAASAEKTDKAGTSEKTEKADKKTAGDAGKSNAPSAASKPSNS